MLPQMISAFLDEVFTLHRTTDWLVAHQAASEPLVSLSDTSVPPVTPPRRGCSPVSLNREYHLHSPWSHAVLWRIAWRSASKKRVMEHLVRYSDPPANGSLRATESVGSQVDIYLSPSLRCLVFLGENKPKYNHSCPSTFGTQLLIDSATLSTRVLV